MQLSFLFLLAFAAAQEPIAKPLSPVSGLGDKKRDFLKYGSSRDLAFAFLESPELKLMPGGHRPGYKAKFGLFQQSWGMLTHADAKTEFMGHPEEASETARHLDTNLEIDVKTFHASIAGLGERGWIKQLLEARFGDITDAEVEIYLGYADSIEECLKPHLDDDVPCDIQ